MDVYRQVMSGWVVDTAGMVMCRILVKNPTLIRSLGSPWQKKMLVDYRIVIDQNMLLG